MSTVRMPHTPQGAGDQSTMSLVDLGKRLLESAKRGETEEVRQLMTNGAPFTTDWLGTSPLHMAAQYGHLTTAEVLLRAGISRDARTKVDRTPLHVAAQEGHLEIVDLLLNHAADIEAKDMLKMTPLHWAIERGHVNVIERLLRSGADVTALSKFDKSAFDIAEDNCRQDLVQLLQEYADNPVKKKEESPSAQMLASTMPSNSVQLITTTPIIATSPIVAKTTTPITLKVNTTCVTSLSTSNISRPVTAANSPGTANTGTLMTSSPTTTSTVSTHTSAKTTSTHPILLHANISHLQKATAMVSSGATKTVANSEEGDSSDQSCTNVLATLAALAEATAPNATISTSEALQWLETHGIAMLPSDNSSIVASALEGGQTISLTEAGKLALSWVKEQQNLGNSSSVTTTQDNGSVVGTTLHSISNSPQKVITIVADHSQLPSIITHSQPTPIVLVSSQNSPVLDVGELPAKKPKLSTFMTESKSTPNGKVMCSNDTVEEERLKLQRELEEARRQAEEYRTQLQQKEHEAEQYRQQLEQMRTVSQK